MNKYYFSRLTIKTAVWVLVIVCALACSRRNNKTSSTETDKGEEPTEKIHNERLVDTATLVKENRTSPPQKKLSHKEKIKQLEKLIAQEYDMSRYKIYFERLGTRKNDKVASLKNIKTKIKEHVVFFDSLGSKIVSRVDLNAENPYLHYVGKDKTKMGHQQIIGYHNLVNTNIDLKDMVPEMLYKVSKKVKYSAVSLGVGCHISGKNHYVIEYTISLMPIDEILQDITIPGMTTIEVYNMKGEKLHTLSDLPYYSSYAEVSPHGKYVVLHHFKTINGDFFNTKPYAECVSVVELKKNIEVYEKCLNNNEIAPSWNQEKNILFIGYSVPRNRDIGKFYTLFLDDLNEYIINHRNIASVKKINKDTLELRLYSNESKQISILNNQDVFDLNNVYDK